MRSPEESWRVIDEALDDATGPRRGQLLAFRANQLVLAARPADVIGMMDTVDYGHLDDTASPCACVPSCWRWRRSAARPKPSPRRRRATPSSSPRSRAVSSAARWPSSTRSGSRSRDASGRPWRSPNGTATSACPSPRHAGDGRRHRRDGPHCPRGDLDGALRHLPTESAAKDADLVLANSFYRFSTAPSAGARPVGRRRGCRGGRADRRR